MRATEKQREATRKWKLDNPEKVREAQRKYSINNREKLREKNRKYRQANPEKQWQYHVACEYGVSAIEFNRMSDAQEFSCAICRNVIEKGPLGKAQTLHIDHDHRHPTKKVRGLLCSHCNSGLGYFKDSLGLMRDAMQYLLDRG